MMSVGELCCRNVVTISAQASIADATALMRHHHVGDVVVVNTIGGRALPLGVITDRDILIEVMSQEVPNALQPAIGDLITREPVCIFSHNSIFEAIETMRSNALRRLPVVDAESTLIGIITADDILGMLTRALSELAAIGEGRRQRERAIRP